MYSSNIELTNHPEIARAHQSALRSIARIVENEIPAHDTQYAREGIEHLLHEGQVLVLTGAGVSTASGIPDYRGESGSLKNHRPMTYQEFRYDDEARQRYWARSYVGWRRMRRAEPNAAHYLLTKLEERSQLAGIITQNVDGLHRRAGSRNVLALHGDLEYVVCLICHKREHRAELDLRIEEKNYGYLERLEDQNLQVNPDGDVSLSDELISDFQMVGCVNCQQTFLKPDVVYFGENVPAQRKAQAWQMYRDCRSVLVVGSSLAVMSGYKFALEAHKDQKPLGIINGGPTRADRKATYMWRSDVAAALAQLM
ncbi:Sir2 family NAD-dependent protein deacetylase [Rothia sp. CCM 9419]|uniref:Sir2 family NAD-dependent protein deacetylase n=1 Tax=Rothia sp. CCM 9419 TaxID=3402662 RepID=UPI003AE5027D